MAASCCPLFLLSSPSSSNASLLPPQQGQICRSVSEAKAYCWRCRLLPRAGTSTWYTLPYMVRSPNRRCSRQGRSAAGAVASMVGRKPRNKQVVVPDPDYRIPVVLLGLAGALVYQDNLLLAAPFGLLGLLLLFQTTRVRFVFDKEALEVKLGEQLQESGENVFVGGKNRWKYSSFVNWELWWPNFPILVYFKETQTKPEGQVHFFPVIFNGKQLYDVMVERAGPSKTSSPRES